MPITIGVGSPARRNCSAMYSFKKETDLPVLNVIRFLLDFVVDAAVQCGSDTRGYRINGNQQSAAETPDVCRACRTLPTGMPAQSRGSRSSTRRCRRTAGRIVAPRTRRP